MLKILFMIKKFPFISLSWTVLHTCCIFVVMWKIWHIFHHQHFSSLKLFPKVFLSRKSFCCFKTEKNWIFSVCLTFSLACITWGCVLIQWVKWWIRFQDATFYHFNHEKWKFTLFSISYCCIFFPNICIYFEMNK